MKKKVKSKKKVQKKTSKQKVRKPAMQVVEIRVRQESTAIVPVDPITSKDLVPLKEGGKYMIPKSWLSERQVLAMVNRTDPKYILKRKAKGGGEWNYVPGWYVVKALNFAFGWNWDYEKVQEPTVAEVIQLISSKVDQIWVTGKLTVKDNDGHSITKTQVGRADIKFRKDTRQPLDIGNDMKAAHTDAMKKCASLLGIASDIYGKNESREEGYAVAEVAPIQAQVVKPTEESKIVDTRFECFKCASFITAAEAEFSKKLYGKPLCREHQKNAKK